MHYEGDYTGAYTDVYSRMYPNFVETEAIGGGDRADLATDQPGRRRSGAEQALPAVRVRATRWATDPARSTEYDALAERYPRLHGGFIWEWRDHGLLTRTPTGREFFGYGGDFGEVVHDGNFVMDGMVLPDGHADAGLAEFAAVHAPVTFDAGRARRCVATNRHHTADHRRTCGSSARLGGGRVADRRAAAGRPGDGAGGVGHAGPAGRAAAGRRRRRLVDVRVELADDQPWAPGRARGRPGAVPAPVRAPAVEPSWPGRGAPAVVTLRPAPLTLGPGDLRRADRPAAPGCTGWPSTGPRLELWRAPTDNDRGAQLRVVRDGRARRRRRRRGSARAVLGSSAGAGAGWTGWCTGCSTSAGRPTTWSCGTAGVGRRTAGCSSRSDYRWRLADDGSGCFVDVVPSPGWDCTWPRVGVRLDLPGDAERASWFGTGPAESYPDTRRGGPGRPVRGRDRRPGGATTRGRRRAGTGPSCGAELAGPTA